ncbi:Glycosyltransferase involved in cell wall bisynthesis [Methylobacterium sp. 190mf]|uniref:glycosyltransferase family 2 protein n=1 Tax=Methylobacterium sp. 190mf TaxID=1761798 RepID=UPI00089EC77F|nr:glycosyltransferase [Methylobacterium sp. 190mf]SEG31566.1 Glycosyltransferase involved in cell wall bisynthesis [Methylobacterium sp. 190mf]
MQTAAETAEPAPPQLEPWQDDFSTIYRSGRFDHLWYAARYPDVGLTDLSPLEHYVKYGARLGRQPRPDFPGTPDEALDGSYVNPFAAWIRARAETEPAPAWNRPVVSVLCITYNQESFIRQTLDSILSQRTDFPFELIVGDDKSSDGTAEIIAEYATRHPNLVAILRPENVGVVKNLDDIAGRVSGEYVAICEGDDYWTDPDKLQRQFDYMQQRPEYTLCYHPVKVVYEDMPGVATIYPEHCAAQPTLSDLAVRNFIQTNSVFYRWRYRGGERLEIGRGIIPADWYIHLMHAEVGRIGFLPQIMAVYRKHAGGIWAHASQLARHKRLGKSEIEFYRQLRGHFGGRFAQSFAASQRLIFARLAEAFLDEADVPGLRRLIEDHPDIAHDTLYEMGFDIACLPVGDVDALRVWLEEQLTVSVIVTASDPGTDLNPALAGILAQRGLFRLRVVVGFERSTQAAAESIAALRAADPDRIDVRPRPQDLGPLRNLQDCIAACDGRYIAFCDADARWISDRKIAKQLRILRSDPKLGLCFNWVLVHRTAEGSLLPHEAQGRLAAGNLRFSDLATEPVTAHRSCGLYRADALRTLPQAFFEEPGAGDWLMDLYVADRSRIAFLREILSVWDLRAGRPGSNSPDPIQTAQVASQRRRFSALFGRGRGFEPYALVCTVTGGGAALSPDFARAHLEAPAPGAGTEIQDGHVVFAGWIVPTYGSRATLVAELEGETHRFPVDQPRSDVVAALFGDAPAPLDAELCGFRFTLPFDQHLAVHLLIETEDTVLTWLSVSVTPRSESEASG